MFTISRWYKIYIPTREHDAGGQEPWERQDVLFTHNTHCTSFQHLSKLTELTHNVLALLNMHPVCVKYTTSCCFTQA